MIKVIIADDVQILRSGLKAVLSQDSDIKVVGEASDGKEAYELCIRLNPDVVLMDMRMPEMDGLEATRTIRSMDREDAKKIPIIALTANAFDEDVQRSLQAGLNAHLSKPVEPDTLFDTLEKLIKA